MTAKDTMERWAKEMQDQFSVTDMVRPMLPFAMQRYNELRDAKVLARMAAIATVTTGLKQRDLKISRGARQHMIEALIELILAEPTE